MHVMLLYEFFWFIHSLCFMVLMRNQIPS